jgi:hypothetical protein
LSIKYLNHPEYLEVIFTGQRSSAALSNLIDEVYKECQKNDLKRILIDLSGAKGELRGFGRFEIGKKVSRVFNIQYKILAIEKEERINKLAENTAVNRGANLLVTSDRKKGLDWLLKDN